MGSINDSNIGSKQHAATTEKSERDQVFKCYQGDPLGERDDFETA